MSRPMHPNAKGESNAAARLAYVEADRARTLDDRQASKWTKLSNITFGRGERVAVQERDGSETVIFAGSGQWHTAVRDLGPDMLVRPAEEAIEEAGEAEAASHRVNPVEAFCPTCEHRWAVAYIPMPLDQLARLMIAARCPKGCSASPRVGTMA